MATIVLQAAGAAIGNFFGPIGAAIGQAVGAMAGSAIDRALINGSSTVSGQRLSSARIPGADDGTAISRLYGTARIGGTLIWATRFEEDATVERSGGKGGGPRTETFTYFANIAMGLCEGPIAGVRRVWADGREIDLTGIEMRVYGGTATQAPDPLIEARQGTGMAPAYRGLAYVVFERLPLDSYGNRIPLLQFEVLRPVGALENQIRAVTLIPGATEHGYSIEPVTESTGAGSACVMNRHTFTRRSDWDAALDELTALCPNVQSVALVVSWFGTDLRAGQCRIVPGVEVAGRDGESTPWSVAGLGRAQAHLVSTSNGGPAYGGTPGDASVTAAIADLKARGLKVFLYPFVMMDIPAGNGLPDPYGGAMQAVYPWRGRITCHPAIGMGGTVDRTSAVRAQVEAFYAGAEGYRAMVLHYAQLAAAAGGVDGFIIGSELRGLTQVRDETGSFPFVSRLVALAGEVRSILGPSAKLTYAADWSEYFGYHPADGSGDVYYHLDPLWAASAIDAVGIDNYMPLSDWRDEDLTAVNPDGFRLADDLEALRRAITSGEGRDWYYASTADRKNRTRTPITDGMAGKPWVYRYKDIENWWSRPHYERFGGAERPGATAWIPRMKPVWFTELGCPAIDKGGNQPNVFVDPKSSETAAPYFSSGARSDSMQRRFLEAHHGWWNSAQAPQGMVDAERMFVWTWDARPFPAFPRDAAVWSDGGNWRTGHWLNGRLGAATLADAIAAILTDHGFTDFDVSQVSGDLGGYVQGEVTSARSLLEPLLEVFQVDVIEDGGLLRFRSRIRASLPARDIAILADLEDEPLWRENRGHDSDYAGEAIVSYYNPLLDYEQASVRSRRVASANNRVLSYRLAAALPEEAALAAAEQLLRDHRIARRSVTFSLPPFDLTVQPGDVLRLADGPQGRFLVTRIEDGAARKVEARECAAAAGAPPPAGADGRLPSTEAANAFAPVVQLLDLPRFEDGDGTGFARAAVMSRPWRRAVLSSSPIAEGYRIRCRLERPARIGTLTAPLSAGVSGRFDHAQGIRLDLGFGSLAAADSRAVLNGANRIAVRAGNGAWEVIGFSAAEETTANRWELKGLLRGLAGTEDAMAAGAGTGSPVVVLDEAVVPLGLTPGEAGLTLNWIVEAAGGLAGAAAPIAFQGGMRAETPLSPVHLRARRADDAGVVFSWIRRGRIDADDWQGSDIPLDEPEERYRLELLGEAGGVVRRVEVTVPLYAYASADESADFGAAQTAFAIRVFQLGRKVPLGIPAAAMVSL